MKQKIISFLVIIALVFCHSSFIIAQTLDADPMNSPQDETPTTDTEATPAESEPVMETVAPADTTPPVISGVMQASVMPTSASFVWSTDELATATFKYGTTESYDQTATLDASQTTMHTATITGLTPATLYYYCITATDSSNNTSSSCGHSFTTEAEETPADTNPPTITSVSVSNITENSADITWTTDEVADGYVEYGTTSSYGSQTELVTDYTTDHMNTLSGLAPDTEYFYRVVSSDGVGNTAKSTENNFTTQTTQNEPAPEPEPAPADPEPTAEEPTTVEPAVISGVEVVNVTADSATITWVTDVLADSQVNYGNSSELGTLTPLDETLKTSHSITITGLTENTAYYFKVISKPAGTTVKTTSVLHDFTTLEVPQETVAPAEIVSITQDSITTTTASISAITDKATTSYIEYGITTGYGQVTPTTVSSTSHTYNMLNLSPDTTYQYRVVFTDKTGNVTYSEDLSFTTLKEENISGAGVSSTPPVKEEPKDSEVIPKVQSTTIDLPTLIEAVGKDNQNFFIWENPHQDSFVGTIIVRKAGGYPTTPTDGELIYEGNSETFTDLNVQNGVTYYYAIYSYNKEKEYSKAIHVKLTPVASPQPKVSSGGGGIIISGGGGGRPFLPSISVVKSPVITEETPAEHFTNELRKGDKGIEVRHLQRLLVADGHLSAINLIDGIFGPKTERALGKFQETYNLPRTLATTPFTRAKLGTMSQNEVTLSLPDDITLFKTNIKIGSKGEDVKMLQKFLVHEGSLEYSLLDGKYGQNTKNGVKNFQIKHNVKPVDGHFGPITRHWAEVISGL